MGKKVIGIDLGTTNSVMAAIEGGQPSVVPNAEGLRTTPSIVAYTKKQELLIGHIAKRQAVINPKNTFFSIKRFIGSKQSDITTELKEFPYDISSDSLGNVTIKCSSLHKEFRPEEISAQILRKLIFDAKLFLGQDVEQGVITVPAYFNDSQRQATMDAGQIAGIEVLRIINEPTAASLAYGLDKNKNQTILVFDLGGGTFDVSILEVGDGIFEVLATSGDTNLGGDNFDQILVNWVLKKFKEREKIDLSNDTNALQRITDAAEKAKIALSTTEETKIYLPFITQNETGSKHIDEKLTRIEFEKLAEELINSCQIPVDKALNDARLNKNEINEVVLVGGSTRLPAIQNLVKSFTDKEPNNSVNPDEVVAIGAALQAGIIAGEVRNVLLLDVTPLSLGIETLGGIMTTVITRNTSVPVRKTDIFSTAEDNQPNVDIHILQGERELVYGNKSLGNFQLNGIPEAERGIPQIHVTFDIDYDGKLSVTAEEKETSIEQSITIHNASTLTDKEVSEMLADAEKNSISDKEKKAFLNLKQEVEHIRNELDKPFFLEKSPFSSLEKIKLQKLKNGIAFTILKEHYYYLQILLNQLKFQLIVLEGQYSNKEIYRNDFIW